MPRKNWLWHTAQFGYALNLFTMETLCLIDYLINGDSNGGIIREELRDNQGSLKQSVGIQWQFILSSCFFQEHLTTLSWNH